MNRVVMKNKMRFKTKRTKIRTIGLVLLILFVLFVNVSTALIIDNAKVIDDTMEDDMRSTISDFNAELPGPLNIVVATYDDLDNPEETALALYNQNNADISVVYSVNNNLLAYATTDAFLSPKTMDKIFGSWVEQKKGITEDSISIFMRTIVDDILEAMVTEEGYGELEEPAEGYEYVLELEGEDALNEIEEEPSLEPGVPVDTGQPCSALKDGICNPDCPFDLDCECGDGICQFHENYETCPDDCEKEKSTLCGVIKDGNCDLNCPMIDLDCGTTKQFNFSAGFEENKDLLMYYLMPVLFFILIMLVIGLAYVTAEVIKDRARRYSRRK